MRADLYRRDLKELEISDGASGFRFVFAKGLDIYSDHLLRIDDRDTGGSFGPQSLVLKRLVGDADQPAGPRRDIAVVNFGATHYDGEAIALRLDMFGRAATCERLECDDAEIEVLDRAAIPDRYFGAVGLAAVRLGVRARPRGGAAAIRLRFAETAGWEPADRLACEILLPARLPEYLDGMAKENMERVSGPGAETDQFAASGLATADRIDAMTRLHFGRALADFGRCLDWGAGSGRVALPMTRTVAPGVALTAADVDGFNVAFGRAHCQGIDFIEAPFLPPLPFADAAFGVIYGVSVLTHLTESAQFAWLAELRRLVPAGAPVIVSVHNEYGAVRAMEGAPETLAEFVRRGFSDHIQDGNLGPKLRETNYYRATFHTHRYLKEKWTRDFEIVKIYSSGNGATQDFVVLKAK